MTDLNKERELKAQIEVFKKEAMELWFVPNLADTYKNKDLFSYSIMDGEVFFMREQARQLWSFWIKAKAQAVPETHLLIPKVPNRDTIIAIASVCLGPAGSEAEFLNLDEAKDVYQALVESESGAEG